MSGPTAVSTESPLVSMVSSAAGNEHEPMAALVVGGVSAALVFELCALFFGPVAGIVIAVVAAIFAVMRRAHPSLLLFAVAACVSALALIFTSDLLFAAALMFGVGLALMVRR